jgi:hypothetical protein
MIGWFGSSKAATKSASRTIASARAPSGISAPTERGRPSVSCPNRPASDAWSTPGIVFTMPAASSESIARSGWPRTDLPASTLSRSTGITPATDGIAPIAPAIARSEPPSLDGIIRSAAPAWYAA